MGRVTVGTAHDKLRWLIPREDSGAVHRTTLSSCGNYGSHESGTSAEWSPGFDSLTAHEMLEPANNTVFCECGRFKERDNQACGWCLFLDGELDGDARLINALRDSGEMTCAELASEFGIHPSGVLHRLQRLGEIGRVTRQWRDNDAVEATTRCRYGNGLRRAMCGGSGHWVYMLTARRMP